MKLTFIGAAHEVTGSCTLLDCCGGNFLIDYGMEQGVNVFENVPLPVLPGQIDAVFLTHAHIDHSGMLPKLYKDGFRGKVYATRATENLCRIMLMDSANIQVSDAEWMNRRAARAGRTAVDPVYTTEDAAGVLRLLRPCSYAERIKAAEGVEVRFTDVGHLLGAACVELWLTEGGETRKLVFSGDVGNTGLPLIGAPLTVDEADYLVIGTLDSYEKLREYYGKEKLVPLYVTVDDGVRLERAIARERQQQEPKYTELCRRFLADEADFSPERLAELDVTEAFENQELEVCVQAIADRIWQETGK